jgi:uncharacterized heparinase superfamily protein
VRTIVRKLVRLGPHPVLIARYVAHHIGRRLHERRLRSRYASLVARPGSPPLRLPVVEIGRAPDLPVALAPAAERIRAEAEAVLRHEVDYLGSGPTPLGDVIDWHRDFKSGYRWPPSFYLDVEVTRLTDDSDAKVPWELSRGHQLLTLARAFALDGDERFADELERQLSSWLDANPPGAGINWVNPMEVAIRAVNWVWAAATAETRRPLDAPLRSRVAESLCAHARHVALNLEGTPYLRSNHYLADVLGLFVIGTVVDAPEAERWLRDGQAALEQEILTQVHDDGLGFEASLPYHGLALEMFLVAKLAADAAGRPFSARYDERLRRMLLASWSVRHANGRLPQFGDGDSGRILPAGFARPATLDHLLWLGAAVAGFAVVLPGPPHEEVAWTAGLDAWRTLADAEPVPPEPRDSFPGGGVEVLRSERVHVAVRCGDVGQNGNGGHAHNDALSFELSLDGTALVVDPGTYVYTSDPAARNAFRSTASHNTLAVESAEINPVDAAQLFALTQRATPVVEERGVSSLVVSHDGYRRLPQQIVHRRRFEVVGDTVSIVDELTGSGDTSAVARLHLAAGCTVGPELTVGHADASVQVQVEGADTVVVDEGWVSDAFGTKVPAPVIAAHVRGTLPLRLVTTLRAVP